MAFDASRPNANGIVDERGRRAREELREPAEVDDATTFPNGDQIYSDRCLWKRISDVVALAWTSRTPPRSASGAAGRALRLQEAT